MGRDLEAGAIAQGSSPISHGGKSAASHPDVVIRGPDPARPCGWSRRLAPCGYSKMELRTSVLGDLASSKPLPATDILGMISTQIK